MNTSPNQNTLFKSSSLLPPSRRPHRRAVKPVAGHLCVSGGLKPGPCDTCPPCCSKRALDAMDALDAALRASRHPHSTVRLRARRLLPSLTRFANNLDY